MRNDRAKTRSKMVEVQQKIIDNGGIVGTLWGVQFILSHHIAL